MTQMLTSLRLTTSYLLMLKRIPLRLITMRLLILKQTPLMPTTSYLLKQKQSTLIQTRSHSMTQMLTSLKQIESCLPTLRLRPLNHSANQTEKKITIEIRVPVKQKNYLIPSHYLRLTQIRTLIDYPTEKQLQTEIETLKQLPVSCFLSMKDYPVLTSNEKLNK